jgi:hypothetical protein
MSKVAANVGRISKPGARFHPHRTLPDTNKAAIRQHNARVGAVMHAYNSAHAAVYMVTMASSLNDSHQSGRDIWFSYTTDANQRMFAKIYCAGNRDIKPPVRRAIIWAISALDELARHRNDAAHSDMVWAYDRLEHGYLAREGTIKRLQESPFSEKWKPLQGDFSALANYLADLQWDVIFRNTWPSTRRPRLLLVRSKPTKKPGRNHRAKRKEHLNQL